MPPQKVSFLEKIESENLKKEQSEWVREKNILLVCEKVKIDIEKFLPKNPEILNLSLDHTMNNCFQVISWYLEMTYSKESLREGNILFHEILQNYRDWKEISLNKLKNFITHTEIKKWALKSYSLLLDYLQEIEGQIDERNSIAREEIGNFSKEVLTFLEVENILKKKLRLLDISSKRNIQLNLTSFIEWSIYIEPIIFELITDLIHNSLKYSEEWSEITCEINQDYHNCTVSISDKGRGLKREEIFQVFEHKKRLQHSDWQKWSWVWSTKLLTVLDRIFWELYVRSKEGVWTEVTFRVPNRLSFK